LQIWAACGLVVSVGEVNGGQRAGAASSARLTLWRGKPMNLPGVFGCSDEGLLELGRECSLTIEV